MSFIIILFFQDRDISWIQVIPSLRYLHVSNVSIAILYDFRENFHLFGFSYRVEYMCGMRESIRTRAYVS